MGPGYLGIAFAVKPTTQKVPLWAFLLASELLDLLSFGFEALGIEKFATNQTDITQGIVVVSSGSVPWSHGLFMSLVWSTLAAVLTRIVYRDRRASIAIGCVVFSHWVLDFIVHPPDLPLLFADSPQVGLGMWGSGLGLIFSGILDIGLLLTGIAIYWHYRRRSAKQ
jgi:hypothetical protein